MFSDHSSEYGGHKVNFFNVGKTSKSVKFFFKKLVTGYVIQLDSDRRRGLDVAFGKYEQGTEVVMWQSHAGKNQIFMINHDGSISPQLAPYFALGMKDGKFRLVKKGSKNELRFENLSVQKPAHKLMKMTLESHPGKGVVLSNSTQ